VRNGWLIAGGAILAIVFSIGWMVKHRRKPPSVQAPTATVFQAPEVTLTGPLQAQTTEFVDATVAGILDAWFVDAGGEVYEDQLVGRIRNADLDNVLESAQAAADSAELRVAALDSQAINAKLEVSRTAADQVRAHNELDRLSEIYERYKHLFEVGALPRLTYEKTDADYQSAKTQVANRDAAAKEAQDKEAAVGRDSEAAKRAAGEKAAALDQAKEAMAACELHSPDDGIVLARDVHQGDKVEAKQHVMTIATELTKLAVSVSPDASVLARIRTGQHASVSLDGAEFPGEVHEVRGGEAVVWFSTVEPVTKLGTAAQVRIVF
jgi:multidrug resistance efflux pump